MIQATHQRFMRHSSAVRSMVYLGWIYSLVAALVNLFVHVFYYQQFSSVSFNILAQAVYFAAVPISFSGLGVLIARWRWNIKWGYFVAFGTHFFGFVFLIGEVSRLDALSFMFFSGLATGLYALTVHCFELTETEDRERDFYSSMLSAGRQIINVLGPALATVLFFISDNLLNIGSYTLLFVVAPMIYLASIPLFKHLNDYRPQPVTRADVKHFLTDRRNQLAHVFYLGGAMIFAGTSVLIPIAATMFLVNEKFVGLFYTGIAVVSFLIVLYLAHRRHHNNRLKYLTIFALASAMSCLLLSWQFTLIMFVVFNLAKILLDPSLRISQHVILLKTVETLAAPNRDFYPTMILRDAALAFWRISFLALLYVLTRLIGEGLQSVALMFVLLAAGYLVLLIGGSLLIKTRQREAQKLAYAQQ